ncbi:MAG: PD40 domain-containing protein [bacterium]|nr:MAG: PD40 domain-containing protein [bacterium]
MVRQRYQRFVTGVVLATLVLLLGSISLRAQTSWFGKNKVQYKDFKWQVLKTPHFDIHFNNGYRDLAARTAAILEYGYDKISNDFSHNIAWRIPIVLYGSHSDFQQTNVTWDIISEGVQAFAEPLRKRMVLHYGGSNVDFAHTTIHELVHIFTFDIVYGSLLKSVFSRNLLFQIPLWFAEGLAEYYSVGYTDEAAMFMRDATVFDYLYDLDFTGGYMVYKSGQAAVSFINETYGPEKVVEIMDHLHHQRSMELALKSTLGITTQELSKEWKKAMRRTYWPLYADKKEAGYYGRRMTDHMKDHHYMNTKPVFSPDGEYIVYYSDRKGLDGIYLMNALTGKVEKKLLIGSISTRFESIRSMTSKLTYSPDGTSIAFVAKSHGDERLFIMSVPGGKILEEVELPLDFFYSPAWSPDGDRIALVGTTMGQTDLYQYYLGSGRLEQITDDVDDEKDPAWFPDGTKLAYCRYPLPAIQPAFLLDEAGVERLTNLDSYAQNNVLEIVCDIWGVDVATGETMPLLRTPGDDRDPIITADGKEIIFTSNEDGVNNLYRGGLDTGNYHRFTDVLGGLFSPSYSKVKDRLAFTAFTSAGYDIFVMEAFTEKSKIAYSTGGPFMAISDIAAPQIDELDVSGAGDTVSAEGVDTLDAFQRIDTDTLQVPIGTVAAGEPDEEEDFVIEGSVEADRIGTGIRRPEDLLGPAGVEERPPDIVIDEDSKEDIHPDTLEAIRARVRKEIGTVKPYSVKFSPDYVGNGMGVFFSTGFGFGLVNQIAFSDLLGDHHIYLAFNIYRSFEDSDLLLSYYYLKKRIDYAFGIFQFKNYLSSRVSSVGETFIDYRVFTERNYGAFGLVSFPFSTFTRLDLEFQGFISEREFFDRLEPDPSDPDNFIIVPGERSTKRLFQPTISLVHDTAYYGSFGPVIGSRWLLSVGRAISFSSEDISRWTALFDYRKYLPLFYRNYLAFRAIGAISEADSLDQRYFFLGGPLTMRGYDYLQFSGPRMLLFNLEYRYPLVDAIIFGWPGRWGIRNIGGTVFLDSGAVYGKGRYVEEPLDVKSRRIRGLEFYSDFGLGFYMRFGFLILNFQLAWPTDFSRTGKSMFHFFLGPMF